MIIRSNRNRVIQSQNIESSIQPENVVATHKIERVQPKAKPLEKKSEINQETKVEHKKNIIKEEISSLNEILENGTNDEENVLLDAFFKEETIEE